MKSILESKTFWTNVIVEALSALGLAMNLIPHDALPYLYGTMATAALNIVLRKLSKTAVSLSLPQ